MLSGAAEWNSWESSESPYESSESGIESGSTEGHKREHPSDEADGSDDEENNKRKKVGKSVASTDECGQLRCCQHRKNEIGRLKDMVKRLDDKVKRLEDKRRLADEAKTGTKLNV